MHSEIFEAFLVTSIALTAVSVFLSRFQVPAIVGFITTGMLIGPSGLNWVKSIPAAQAISELGIILLMFSLGLEISLEHLRKMIRPLISLGLIQVLGTMWLTTVFCIFVLDLSFAKSFIFGACLALSSTAVVLKLLSERRDTETPYGRVTVIVLLFQDIASLPLMAMIPLLATSSFAADDVQGVGWALAKVASFVVGALVVGYFAVPRFFNEVLKARSREVFFFSILSFTFFTAYCAELAGLSMSLGAFLAGVLISESPVNKQALAEVSPFRDNFLGFFFASVGMLIDLKFVLSHLQNLAWLIPVALLIKFVMLYWLVRRNSHSHGVSFASALALSQIGEFSFILAASAFNQKIISPDEFQYFLALAIVSLLLTPSMLQFGLRGSAHSSWPELADSLKVHLGLVKKTANTTMSTATTVAQEATQLADESLLVPRQALVIGLGHAGRKALQELHNRGIPCAGVDLNIDNVNAVKQMGIEGYFGDCTSKELLGAVGVGNAFLVIVTVSGRYATPKIISAVKHLNPSVNLLVRIHYLQELADLRGLNPDQIIVSEMETAQSILDRALNYYGLSVQPLSEEPVASGPSA